MGNGHEMRSQSSRKVGQFLHLCQGDHEAMASKITLELEEQTASAAREEQLRGDYAIAAEQLRQELSEETVQRFQYFEQKQSIFALARLRTVESALGCEYATAQQNLQQQYLTQIQGLQHELQTAQRVFSDLLLKDRAEKNLEIFNP